MEKKCCIAKLSSMKRKFVCALICLLPIVAKASVHEYASNSILSDGTFIKVSVQNAEFVKKTDLSFACYGRLYFFWLNKVICYVFCSHMYIASN